MTFEQMCDYHGWEPKAVRAILKMNIPIKIEIAPQAIPDEVKRKKASECLQFIIDNMHEIL